MNPSERFVVYPALLAVGVLAGTRQGTQPVAEEATFRRVTIVGDNGTPRVVIGAREAGDGILVYDLEGRPRVRLTGAVEVGVAVLGLDEKPRVGLAVSNPPLGSPTTQPRQPKDEGFLFTSGPSGRVRVFLGTAERSGGALSLFGPTGTNAAVLTSTDGYGGLALLGPDGKPRVEMGRLEESEGGTIRALGTTGKPYAVMCALDDGGYVMTTKPSGDDLWSSRVP